MGNLFGTDGIRGKANVEPMTAETALMVGRAVTHFFRHDQHHPRVVIGKDTRISGYVFEFALVSGICSMGGTAYILGPLPTPGVAFMARSMRADAGIVISASHNPYKDNGIKIFNGEGRKLQDAQGEFNKMIAKVDGEYRKAVLEADAYFEQMEKLAQAIEAEGKAQAQGIKKEREALVKAGGAVMVKLAIAEALKENSEEPDRIHVLPASRYTRRHSLDLPSVEAELWRGPSVLRQDFYSSSGGFPGMYFRQTQRMRRSTSGHRRPLAERPI